MRALAAWTTLWACLFCRSAHAQPRHHHHHIVHHDGRAEYTSATADASVQCPEVDIAGSWDDAFTVWTHHDDAAPAAVAGAA